MENKILQETIFDCLSARNKDPNIIISKIMDVTYDKLIYVATSITKDYHLSQEVVNDVYISIFKEDVFKWIFRILVDCDANFAGYIYTTCVNKARNAIRGRKYHESIDSEMEQTIGGAPSDYDYIDFDINKYLKHLSPNENFVLRKYLLEGLQHSEIAEFENVGSVVNSRALLYRARKKLQKVLLHYKS